MAGSAYYRGLRLQAAGGHSARELPAQGAHALRASAWEVISTGEIFSGDFSGVIFRWWFLALISDANFGW